MRKIRCILILAVLMFGILCGCADTGAPVSEGKPVIPEVREGKAYHGFDDAVMYPTPEEAMADGCFTIVSEGDDRSLYGGDDYWRDFLYISENGEDAFLKIAHFIDGNLYMQHLIYADNLYYYFDAEYEDLTCKPFQYLRKLTGPESSERKELVRYVLTDSLELTCDQVFAAFYSSSMDAIKDVPEFQWLGFTTYLNNNRP